MATCDRCGLPLSVGCCGAEDCSSDPFATIARMEAELAESREVSRVWFQRVNAIREAMGMIDVGADLVARAKRMREETAAAQALAESRGRVLESIYRLVWSEPGARDIVHLVRVAVGPLSSAAPPAETESCSCPAPALGDLGHVRSCEMWRPKASDFRSEPSK